MEGRRLPAGAIVAALRRGMGRAAALVRGGHLPRIVAALHRRGTQERGVYLEMSLGDLRAGVYLLHLHIGDRSMMRKVVKQ